MNDRRKMLIALGASALAAPLHAFAQQQRKVWRVGFLSLQRRPESLGPDAYGPFEQGMRELGYVEGKNLALERRYADSNVERLPAMATELVKMNVDIIVTVGPQTAGAAQKATTTIPIVMAIVNDPVGSGFVKSLARPGGNITGLSNITEEIGPKHLEMLIGMVPKLSRVAVLSNPTNSAHTPALKYVQAAARRINVTILPVEARSPQGIENAFSAMALQNAGAVIVMNDGFFLQQRHQIADLARKHRLPSISASRTYAEAGCLLSYGNNPADFLRHAATYVDKILKGAKPGDLPVEQPTKFELIINSKTAKVLGLTIPQSLLISADKMIE